MMVGLLAVPVAAAVVLGGTVAGADLVHLLAELLDNAAAGSPPATRP